MRWATLLLVAAAACGAARGARILAVVPYNAPSHFVMYRPLLRALAARGHSVDVLSHFPLAEPTPNYRHLSLEGSYDSWEDNVDLDLVLGYNPLSTAYMLWLEALDVCAKAFEAPGTRELLSSNATYDLVISEIFAADCMVGFAHRFDAPLVGVMSSVALPWALDRVGNPDHPAYTSNYFLPYTERMSFWERLVNTAYGWGVRRLYQLVCNRATDSLARRYFGPDLPDTSELVKNTSLVLVNSHFSVNQARPMLPAVVEVGGLHIGTPKKLPEELERWMSASEHGVVYLSLGSMVRLASFPTERLAPLLDALGALPQRVLLKTRDPLPLPLPRNARAMPHLPQFDVLSHPKTRVFFTHGGLMGTQEAAWAGVPMLGMPIFSDQRLNLYTFQSKGVALVAEYESFTRDSLHDALTRLIEDKQYRERARALSRQFRDRPQAALSSAVWWVEYVARHGGARHLRSAAADLPLHQYLLLDVLGALAAAAAAALGALWCALAAVYRVARFGSRPPRRAPRGPVVTPQGRVKRYTKTKQH